MVDRLKAALRALRADQQRVVAAAIGVLISLALPWYTKLTTVAPNPVAVEQRKPALFVPSLVEASIMLVAIAAVALMVARGAQAKFFLPVADRVLVMAAGMWTFLLIFYRFVDQPAGQTTPQIATSYELSWGIFFGLIAAGVLFASGLFLHEDASTESERGPEPVEPEIPPAP